MRIRIKAKNIARKYRILNEKIILKIIQRERESSIHMPYRLAVFLGKHIKIEKTFSHLDNNAE